MELTLSELQEMATRQQQQIEAQQQMLVAKVTPSSEPWASSFGFCPKINQFWSDRLTHIFSLPM